MLARNMLKIFISYTRGQMRPIGEYKLPFRPPRLAKKIKNYKAKKPQECAFHLHE